MKGKYLITTDNWFLAPDGNQYKAAWGNVQVLEDAFLGVKTNRNSTNWFLKVGNSKRHIIIAGCQIHYAIKSSMMPNINSNKDWGISGDGKIYENYVPSRIWIAE